MPRDWSEEKNPNYVDIQKKDLKTKILEEYTSKELADYFDVNQNTITNKVQKFWDAGLREVRKKLYENNAKYGRCKVCNQPLESNQSTYCSNECKFSDEEYNQSRVPSKKNNENKKAVCKLCDYESTDYKNLSGALTKHFNQKHDGDFKVEELFQIEEKEDVDYLECPECDWKTKDVENQSGSFTKHIQKEHEGVLSLIESYPNLKNILPVEKYKRKKRLGENGVKCEICGKLFDKLTNTHLKKHDITPTEYKIKYESKTYSEDHYEKCKEHYHEFLKGNGAIFVSNAELELKNFIESLGINNIKTSVRSIDEVSEIDILLPDFDLGIEYNGLPYHSEGFNDKDKWSHWNKTKKCKKNGVNLIQVFGDQWRNKKEIVKSRLKHKLSLGAKSKIGARECKSKEINNTQKRLFLDKNHIRGTVGSSVSLGLEKDDELLAVMTFGHSSSDYEHELSRFAVKQDSVVYGAAGKLFSHFRKTYDPDSVVTYLDLSWSSRDDNLYSQIGFEFDGEVDPSYTYTKNYHKRLHKSNFSKSSIKRKYPEKFDPNLTEWGNMKKLGFDRIWDCGKIRYLWK